MARRTVWPTTADVDRLGLPQWGPRSLDYITALGAHLGEDFRQQLVAKRKGQG